MAAELLQRMQTSRPQSLQSIALSQQEDARGYPLVQVSDPSIPPHVSPSGSVETYHPEADGPNSFDAVDEDSVTDSHDLNTCSQGTAPPRWHSAQRPAVPLNLAPYNGSCRHRLHYVTTM